MKLKIALLQLLPGNSLKEQMDIGTDACRKAKEKGADIALFPEMWSTGYRINQNLSELQSEAVSLEGEFVTAFKELAEELEMAIGITLLEKNIGEGGSEGKPFNSMVLFDRHGSQVLHYAKVHTCAFAEEKILESGPNFNVADLDTAEGFIRVGSMICFDREFPESARILMLKGAELILAPNACPMEINRLSALRTRAYENMLAVATCNYPKGQPDCNGRSTVFDGVAWLRDEPGVRDMCILEAPEEPGIYLAETDVDKLRAYRSNEVMGDAFRRPGKYEILTKERDVIETERLFLMPMRLRFLNSTGEYATDKDAIKYMVFLPHESLEETRNFILDCENEQQKEVPCFYEYACVYEGSHVGTVSLYLDDECPGTAELGWVLNPKYQHLGLCAEAVSALIKYAGEKLNIKHFVVHCDFANEPSRKVMERLGMVKVSESDGRFNRSAPDEERKEFKYELRTE